MRIALGVIVSAGYRADTDFIFGRPDCPNEGLYALQTRVQSGEANRHLPTDLQITGLRLILSRKFPTDVARNEVCAEVLKGNEDYLLFLDADMVHPADLIERLLAVRADVVTARYHLKKAPFAAIAYVKHRTQVGPHRYASIHFGRGQFEIERGGAGALLIARSVLEDIKADQLAKWDALFASPEYQNLPQWFKDYSPRWPLVQWFRYQQTPDGTKDLGVSEDFWFWQQARETGHLGYIDWDCVVPHIGPMAIDDTWNQPFLHTQISEYENPDTRELVLNNTIVRNYPEGMYLGEDKAYHVPEYQISAGER